MSLNLIPLLAGFAGGYMSESKSLDERERKKKIEDEERAYKNELRDRQRQQWSRDDALHASMVDAANPVRVSSGQLQGPVLDGQAPLPSVSKVVGASGMSAAYKTPEEANAAAAEINVRPIAARMADAYMAAGRPLEAMQLRGAERAEQLGKIQLDEVQTAHLNKIFDADLEKKASDFDSLADFVSNSSGDGQAGALKVKAVASADGKKVTLAKMNPDGSLSPTPYTFDNTAAGLVKAKALLSKSVTPEGKLTHLHQQAMEELEAKKADNQERYQQGMLKNASDLTAAKIEMASMRAAAAKAAGGAQPAIWNDKADEFLKARYTVKDEMTGATSVDGAGMMFAKQLALARARENGGDTTMALGAAFDVDNQLRAAAKGDAAKLNALRQQYVAAVLAPPKPPAPTAAPPARTAPQAQASMTRAAAAPPVAPPAEAPDPMRQRFVQESNELNRGTRTDFSPEVKQYAAERRAAEKAAQAAANEEYKRRELERALKLSRQQLGR